MKVRSQGLNSIRKLSACRLLSGIYTKTTINPLNFKLIPPTTFAPKSLLLLSTPSSLTQLIEESINIHQRNGLQVITAGIDCMIPNSKLNGISEMWLDNYIEINDSVQLDERDNLNDQPRASDGVNIVKAAKNWKIISSNLSINVSPDSKIDLKLANTVFSTANLVTLFYLQPSHLGGQQNSGHTLCDLSISLPSDLFRSTPNVKLIDKWTPLFDSGSESLVITNCVGNLVKSINGNSAASYLEQNDRLMSIGSKDTEVYVKIFKANLETAKRFKVIAGGGEWGSKASILAISPEAKLDVGDRIEFYMLTPEDRFSVAPVDNETLHNKLTFECAYEEQSYGMGDTEDTVVLENVFGCGSVNGFNYNNIQHASAGERVSISL